jgi:hypothetical protein
MSQYVVRHKFLIAVISSAMLLVGVWVVAAPGETNGRASDFLDSLRRRQPSRHHQYGDRGVSAAILPNGRLGDACRHGSQRSGAKPFGLALSPDGAMLATLNSGAAPFSPSR